LLSEIDFDDEGPVPERYELGALPIELLDGLTAAIDHLAGLDESASGTRRERLLRSFASVAVHEHRLLSRLESRLRALPGVTVLGAPAQRVPVTAFTVLGNSPAKVGTHLAQHNISVWTGPSGTAQLMSVLGVDELGGAVHVGLMPHSTRAEVDQLITALSRIAG